MSTRAHAEGPLELLGGEIYSFGLITYVGIPAPFFFVDSPFEPIVYDHQNPDNVDSRVTIALRFGEGGMCGELLANNLEGEVRAFTLGTVWYMATDYVTLNTYFRLGDAGTVRFRINGKEFLEQTETVTLKPGEIISFGFNVNLEEKTKVTFGLDAQPASL